VNDLEPRLARAFGAGLGVAMLFLAVGLVFRPALWAGILTLALVPPVGAALTWRSADRQTRVAIVLSSLGVIAAIAIGLLLRA
jgi:predicted PurR-regulated permease PerM